MDDTPLHERISLLELKPNHCRWILNDGGPFDPRFCGRPKAVISYCEDHAKRAFVPAQKAHKLWHGV